MKAAVIRLVRAVLLKTHAEWQTADRASCGKGSIAQPANLSEDDPDNEMNDDDLRHLPATSRPATSQRVTRWPTS